MKTKTKILNLLTWSSLILSTPAQAVNINLDNSWEKFGDVEIANPNQANLSTDGLFDDDLDLNANNGDFNYSGNPAGQVGFVSPDLTEFLGINVDALDMGGFAFEGSAIKRTFNVNAGDKLKFAWNFRTNETALATDPFRGSFVDYSFFLVNNQVTKLADINNATVNSAGIFDKETGMQNYQYTFNNAGTYTVALGLVDIDDFAVTSALSVNNVDLEPVPEPLTIFGTGVALGFGFLFKKGRNRRK